MRCKYWDSGWCYCDDIHENHGCIGEMACKKRYPLIWNCDTCGAKIIDEDVIYTPDQIICYDCKQSRGE